MSVDRRFALLRHNHGMGEPDPFTLTNVADGDILQYDAATGKWANISFPTNLDSPADGDMIQYSSSTGKWEKISFPTNIASPSDGDIIQYDSGTGKWEKVSFATNISGAVNGHILVWDGSAWVNQRAKHGDNLIRNGGFHVWQFGTSYTGLSAGTISMADRWYYHSYGAAVCNINRQTATHPSMQGGLYASETKFTTADASIGATDYYGIEYRMEGIETHGLAQGNANARTVTISWTMLASVNGTYCVAIQNAAQNRSYVAEVSYTGSGGWQRVEATLTLDTGGTWLNGQAATGMRVFFTAAGGSNYQGTKDQWNAADDRCTSSQANAAASTNNLFRVASVKLEIGDHRTYFESSPFMDELHNCQRFRHSNFAMEVLPADNLLNAAAGHACAYSTGSARSHMQWKVQMASNPSITFYRPVSGTTSGMWSWYLPGTGWLSATSMSTTSVTTSGGTAQLNDSSVRFTAREVYLVFGPYKAVSNLT